MAQEQDAPGIDEMNAPDFSLVTSDGNYINSDELP